MKLMLFCFKDKQVDRYTIPNVSQILDSVDLADDVRSQIIRSDKRDVFKGKNLVVLGTFDNSTGIIECHDPEFVLNCDEVISNALDYERSKEN